MVSALHTAELVGVMAFCLLVVFSPLALVLLLGCRETCPDVGSTSSRVFPHRGWCNLFFLVYSCSINIKGNSSASLFFFLKKKRIDVDVLVLHDGLLVVGCRMAEARSCVQRTSGQVTRSEGLGRC